jgi:small-conductance mechanosensitive channel
VRQYCQPTVRSSLPCHKSGVHSFFKLSFQSKKTGALVMNDFFDVSEIISAAITVLVIAIVAWLLSRVATRLINAAVARRMERLGDMSEDDRANRTTTVAGTLSRVARVAIWAMAAVTALGEFGVNVAPIITGLGIGALALAFAAKNIIRD